jgi:hypothetical protein
MAKTPTALDTALDELERVTGLWRESEIDRQRCCKALEWIKKKAADKRNPQISFVADMALRGVDPSPLREVSR